MTLRAFPGVSIAAVDGPAIGLGVDLAMACDHRYIGANGWFLQGWASIRAIPGTGGAWLLTRRGGALAAWELLLSQERFGPDKAERFGLAISVDGEAEVVARKRAADLALLPHEVVLAYKSLIAHSDSESYAVHLARCLEYQVEFLTSESFFAAADSILPRR
jgi:enoyl-CoA hydratase/carnithine racemase